MKNGTVKVMTREQYLTKIFKAYSLVSVLSDKNECTVLKLKNKELFIKIKDHKQSSYNYKERKQIANYIKLKHPKLLTDKKYLIVDDVYTSGQTLKTIINILVKNKVKKENIKALILSKTPDSVEL